MGSIHIEDGMFCDLGLSPIEPPKNKDFMRAMTQKLADSTNAGKMTSQQTKNGQKRSSMDNGTHGTQKLNIHQDRSPVKSQ